MTQVWAAFGRQCPNQPWRLQTFSAVSAERARGLIEREQVRANLGAMEVRVREYDGIDCIPWTLDADVEP